MHTDLPIDLDLRVDYRTLPEELEILLQDIYNRRDYFETDDHIEELITIMEEEGFRFIEENIGRIIFELNSDKILKIAKPSKAHIEGRRMNERESVIYTIANDQQRELLADVFYMDSQQICLEMEKPTHLLNRRDQIYQEDIDQFADAGFVISDFLEGNCGFVRDCDSPVLVHYGNMGLEKQYIPEEIIEYHENPPDSTPPAIPYMRRFDSDVQRFRNALNR